MTFGKRSIMTSAASGQTCLMQPHAISGLTNEAILALTAWQGWSWGR